MISTKIADLLNEQITNEQFAAQYYLSMSAWFSARDLDGIANYFRVQSKEELMHADKMFDYLNDVGVEIRLGAIQQPPYQFENATSIFATVSFLQWFVTEQIEEEASASQLVTKIKMVCDNPSALYLFDQELSQRVLGPIA